MAIDPRMFLGIGGPVGPQALTPGFRPPGPAPNAPLMQAPQMAQQQMGIPGMGLGGLAGLFKGDSRTANGGDLGGYSKTPPGGMVDVGGGTMLPNPNGQQYGAGGVPLGLPTAGGGLGGGSFLSWLRGLF